MDQMAGGADHGFWGPITANIDWCEANYEVTFYIAEFWNTISNIWMILLSIVGVIEGWRGRHIEFHYMLPFFAMIAVGLGSILFHMSLLYHLQLFDEMPMIWGTASIVYCVQELDKDWKRFNAKLAIFLFICCFVSCTTYVVLDDRLIFEGTYAAMVVYSMSLLAIRVYTIDSSALSFFIMAMLCYGSAFTFWITDRIHCSKLREIRQSTHPILHPFSQFHAIWHVLVGFGAHAFLMLLIRTRFTKLSKPFTLGFRYGMLPYYTPSVASQSVAEQGGEKSHCN